jgi:DNA-directed RNA polymerase subunit M/transcription elongation factor TFIIS
MWPTARQRAAALLQLQTLHSHAEAADLEHACAVSGHYRRAVLSLLHRSTAMREEATGPAHLAGLPRAGALFVREAALRNSEAEARALLERLSTCEAPRAASQGVVCAKCGGTEVALEFSQTRSADEGTTLFCLCTQCGKRWRM